MSLTLPLRSCTRQQRSRRRQRADAHGSLKLVQRLHAVLALSQDLCVREIAEMWALGAHTVRDDRHALLWTGVVSLVDKRPSGRPSTRTKTPHTERAALLQAGPQAAGSPSGCWTTPRMQDRIARRFGVTHPPHSIATLLGHLGFSSHQARLVSDHRKAAKRLAWRQRAWPRMLRQARQRKAL